MAEASTIEEAESAPRARTSPIAQLGWALYDSSRSPYIALGTIFIFSAYFTSVVIGDPVKGQVTWSYMTAIVAVLVAVGAPIAGAIADAGGRRKPWLAACVLMGAPCMACLWFATPGMTVGIGWMIAALVGAGLSIEYSAVFCNSMLPLVAPPGRIGFLSGLGLALANVWGIVLFLFFLLAWSWNPHPLFGLDVAAHEPERAVGPMAGLWFLLFALPLFFVTPDSPGSDRSAGEAIRGGLRNLGHTIARLGNYRNVATYLVARMIFNEGFIVLMLFTGVFAAGILHWTAAMLTAEGLINSVVAALGALFAGWLDDKIGSKASTMVFVAGCLVCNVIIASVTQHSVFFVEIAVPAVAPTGLFPTLPDQVFLVVQCFTAFFVTGGLVSSRALMARISPRAMLAEFFGLFALSGTATSFLGPLAIGLLTGWFHSQRAGVAVGVGFFTIGLLGMTLVKGEADA